MPFVHPQNRRTVIVVLLLVAALSPPLSAHAQEAGTDMTRPGFTPASGSASDISFLIGTWHVSEVIYPGRDNEWLEVAVRVCAPALQETYVVCTTRASGRGRQREYIWLINQSAEGGEVEVFGFYSNLPSKGVFRGTFLPDGSGLDLRNHDITADAVVPGRFQRLRFVSADEFEWQIGIENPGTAEETVIGIERSVRVSDVPLRSSVR